MSSAAERLNAALSDRYRIERELGAGGMATVYLAHDLKHDRKVALKVLKPELAAVVGSERFLAEIRTTANLQHPHILPLFDSGEADGFLFFVMPYVEGESLRDRLDREKQLPVDEAVRIASEIADALAHAHDKGVIHRDIKPANILLRDGRVQVADFGIALAVQQAGGTRLTETGLSVGTPHYMSPEQATGDRQLDPRSDLYSLGCVVYEMLAGEPPHSGATAQAVLARILTETPRELRDVRDTVPPQVAAAVMTALRRLPADRFSTAGVFAEAMAGPKAALPEAVIPARQLRSSFRLSRALPWVVAATAVLLLLIRPGETPDTSSDRWNIVLPDTARLVFVGEATLGVGQTALTISPDGSTIVYVGEAGNTTRLYRRRTDGFDVVPIPGTEGAYKPFFAPDGRRVGFFASDQLKVAMVDGSGVRTIKDVGDSYGGSWSDANRIAVAAQDGSQILIVTEGEPDQRIPIGTIGARTLSWLPDSDWVLHDCRGLFLCVTSSLTGETRYLTLNGPAAPQPDGVALLEGEHPFVTRNGFLLFGTPGANNMMAVPFDKNSLAPQGQPHEVLRGLRREAYSNSRHFAVSDNGLLVYVEGAYASRGELVWVDREGREEMLPFPPQIYGAFALSPDGREIAAPVTTDAGSRQLLFLDTARQRSRVWMGPYDNRIFSASWWDGDSGHVYAWAVEEKNYVILRIAVGATGGGEVLYEGGIPFVVEGGVDDGRLIVDEYSGDLFLVDPVELGRWSASEERTGAVPGPGGKVFGALSPDGRWFTYTLLGSRYETYAVPFPFAEAARATMISNEGGESALWSPKGDGLFYRDGRRWYWVASRSNPDQPFSAPELFAEGNYLQIGGVAYAVAPDGDRLLLARSIGAETTGTLHVVTNWFPLLEQQATRR